MRGVKVQITLSEDMVCRVDDYAKSMGISRSALCAIFIGQGIMSYDKTFDTLSRNMSKEVSEVVGVGNESVK